METYLLKKAKLVSGEQYDILIENGLIEKIAPEIVTEKKVTQINFAADEFVSSGWLDIHTHCFEKFEIYADDADEIGYKKGVTTVIDAGTSGSDTMDEFVTSAKMKKTRVYAFMNISKPGIYAQHELANLADLDIDAFTTKYHEHQDFIIGIKARMSKSVVLDNNLEPLKIAKTAAIKNDLPLMVHIGTNPPALDEVFELMRKGDIVTHIFNPKANGILDTNGKVKSFVFEAAKKGLIFDVGHGTESFSFETFEKATAQGIKFDTISSDIYSRNRMHGPVYDLPTTMTKFLAAGVPLSAIIDSVTKNAAAAVRLPKLGELKVGNIGDITVFKLTEESKTLVDSKGDTRIATTVITPTAVLVKNNYYKI